MLNANQIKSLAVVVLLPLLLAAICGCTAMDLSKGLESGLPWPGNKKPQIPARMVAMWTDTVMQQSGQQGIRGFGGRLMFYKNGKAEPVKVDGTLTVFAFRDNGSDPTSSMPEKKYVFLPEQLEKHYSESELGHSYSVWLPWDEVGGTRQKLSLVVRFEPKLGPSILSKPSLQRLPGAEPRPLPRVAQAVGSQFRKTPSGIRRVSHEEPIQPTKPTEPVEPSHKLRIITTDTIDLPPSFLKNRQGKVADVCTSPTKSAAHGDSAAALSGPRPPRSNDYRPSRSPARTSTQARPILDRVRMPPFQIKRRYRPEPLPPVGQPTSNSAIPSSAAAGPLELPAVVAD